VIALDPETGTQRWAYDARIELDGDYGDGLVNRGAATWLDSHGRASALPPEIIRVPQDARLVAIDAASGAACADFGKGGQVNLSDVSGYQPAGNMTSPPP